MHAESPAYGLWSLVILNSLVFIIFAFSFTKPRTSLDRRSFGAFSAFIVALFTEMYGFPLTIYLLLPWLSRRFPGTDFLSHDAGHLLETMFGWKVNPHFGPFHVASSILIVLGFMLLASAWLVTPLMFPVLLVVYARLARREERDSIREFGAEYERYRDSVPAFIPEFGHHRHAKPDSAK